ncbi:aminotransferase class III-fold pyridoxal phosphate-dependent enzyme [Nocardia asteroides]|uniref:aminotransferase class III-fold pyridoxal phosphate-dependent enzyme n=1 Tax=Nocardia asteroides TaxID=1824 RepID=UPI0037CC6D1E
MTNANSLVHALRPVYAPIVSADGARLRLADGSQWIDLASQTLNTAWGVASPVLTEAIITEARNRVHYASSRFGCEPYLELADRLARLAPPGMNTVNLKLADGSDAVETAIKLAVVHTRRHKVAVLPGAWHGETWLTLGLATSHKGRMICDPDIAVVAPAASVAALTELVLTHGDLAAAILDPAMVAQGLVPQGTDIRGQLAELRAACTQTGCLLIFDEIQTFGWMPELFVADCYGVEPDVICLGKALGAGMPLAAVIMNDRYRALLGYNDAEFTGGGAPLSCAAALAGLDALIESRHTQAARIAAQHALLEAIPEVEVRQVGGIATITRRADRLREAWTNRVVSAMAEQGVFVRTTDQGRRVLLKPPLVLSLADMADAFALLGIACQGAERMVALPPTSDQSSSVQRRAVPVSASLGTLSGTLAAAAPRLTVGVRNPIQQQRVTRRLRAAGVPVVAVYAAGDGFVDHGTVSGRTLRAVLADPATPGSTINGLALKHLETVCRIHDQGVVLVDRRPDNTLVSESHELTLVGYDLQYFGAHQVAAAWEETLAVMYTIAAVPPEYPERTDLAGRLVDHLRFRWGSRVADVLDKWARHCEASTTDPDDPPGDVLPAILWAAKERVTRTRP